MPGKLGLLGCVGRGNLEAEDLFGHGEIGGPLLGVGEVDPVAAGDLEAEEGGEEAVVFAVDDGGGGGAEGVAVELALDGGAGDRFSAVQDGVVGAVRVRSSLRGQLGLITSSLFGISAGIPGPV
jgi:hypothetical protein